MDIIRGMQQRDFKVKQGSVGLKNQCYKHGSYSF